MKSHPRLAPAPTTARWRAARPRPTCRTTCTPPKPWAARFPGGQTPAGQLPSIFTAFPDVGSPLIRTWFGSDESWQHLIRLVETPSPEGFLSNVVLIDDHAYEGMTALDLRAQHKHTGEDASFIADMRTLTEPDSPILAVWTSSFEYDASDVCESQLRPFRVIPSQLWSVEANINIANMDWWDFLEAVGDDDVFRGF